jgi:hypothetical protein
MIKIKQFTTYQTGGAAVLEGHRKDGGPIVRHPVVSRAMGEIVREAPELEARLIAEGSAEPARLSDKLAALAAAVLAVDTPLDAVLAALAVPGVRPWHATRQGAHWFPAAASLGPGRGGFSARFTDPGEARALWADKPDATPLFSFATPHGFDRAFIWRQRGLLEIATEIQNVGRY